MRRDFPVGLLRFARNDALSSDDPGGPPSSRAARAQRNAREGMMKVGFNMLLWTSHVQPQHRMQFER
jgi:hypothetical protein